MTRPCTVCQHPAVEAIDRALVAGEPAEKIARYRSLSPAAVKRHRSEHLAPAMLKATEAADVAHALDITRQLRAINGATLSILNRAQQAGDADTALRAVDRVQRQIELQARLLGEIDDRPQIGVLLAPEWLTVRAALLEALGPYGEARVAVARRLRELEAASQGDGNGHRG